MPALLVFAAFIAVPGVDTWESMGPDVASSEYAGEIQGTGELYCHAAYPGADEMFLSYDGGELWYRSSILEYGCNCVTADDFGRLLVGGYEHLSIYFGGSWSVFSLPSGVVFEDIAVNPFDPNQMLGAVYELESPLFYSSDGGMNWFEAGSAPAAYGRAVGYSPDSSGVMYFAGKSSDDRLKLYRSSDQGASWTDVSPEDVSCGAYQTIFLEVASTDTVVVSSYDEVYFTGDGGGSWQFALDADQMVCDMHYDPVSGNVYLVSYHKLYSSVDKGQTWTLDYTSPHYTWAVAEADGAILLGTDEGLFVASEPSGPWTRTGRGIPGGCIGDMARDPETVFPVFAGHYFMGYDPYDWYECEGLPLYGVISVDRSDTSSDILFAGGEYG